MKSSKERFKNLHQNRPYLEPIFLSLYTIAIGFILNMYTAFLSMNPTKGFWSSVYLWILLLMVLVIILYYVFLSTYTNRYRELIKCVVESKKAILTEYVAATIEQLKTGNLTDFRATTIIFKKSNIAISEISKGIAIDEMFMGQK